MSPTLLQLGADRTHAASAHSLHVFAYSTHFRIEKRLESIYIAMDNNYLKASLKGEVYRYLDRLHGEENEVYKSPFPFSI